MSTSVRIDPLTRIEGHLAIRVEVGEDQKVAEAYCAGEMFRGFEVILKGRHPMDAQQITQRICGVCPISHATASILAQEMAYGVTPPPNGRLVRNLILGANYIQSHIVHFYHLSALDFVDIAAILQYDGADPSLLSLQTWVKAQVTSGMVYPAAPFLPRYDGDYVKDVGLNVVAIGHYLEGLEMRALAHQMAGLFAGKLPHSTTMVPGGVTEKVSAQKIAAYGSKLQRLQAFIEHCYVPDAVAVAQGFPEYFQLGKGCGNFLAYGAFPESEDASNLFFPSGVVIQGAADALDPSAISEDIGHSLFSSGTGIHPSQGETVPAPRKGGAAYSWLKAPRYRGQVMEVGPLARVLVAYAQKSPGITQLVDAALAKLNRPQEDLLSAMGRHVARALECKLIAQQCAEWLNQLVPGEPTYTDYVIPKEASGFGLTEAPRGALGHWITVRDEKIDRYQCVVPTTWNCSPRDDAGVPGAVEQALIGTPVANREHPIEAARVVRSFDPCLACAVH